MTRAGFVLPLVLVVVAATFALAAQAVARTRVALAQQDHRIGAIETRWIAEGCVARLRWAMRGSAAPEPRHLAAAPECEATARPVGVTIPVAGLDSLWMTTFLRAIGRSPATTDSMVAAWLDWQDPDDDPRPNGAEAPWYDAHDRPRPRNATLRALDELARIRGFESVASEAAPDLLLTVDPDPLDLAVASAATLRTLPGATPAFVEDVQTARRDGRSPLEAGRHLIEGDPVELLRRVTVGQGVWDITVVPTVGRPGTVVSVTVRLRGRDAEWAVERHRTEIR